MAFKLKFCFTLLLTTVIFMYSCKKEYSCEGCNDAGNKPPVAKAGPDRSIQIPTDSTTLDGSVSRDPDGSIVSFQWQKINGPVSSTIRNSSLAVTTVKNLTAGTYLFELKVTDNGSLTAVDTMMVLVIDPSQPNRPPVANAGPDQSISLPTNATSLDGTASSDPDNNITSYRWSMVNGPSTFNLANAQDVQSMFTSLVEGDYYVELKVTDAGNLSSSDTVKISVLGSAPPPTACNSLNRPIVPATLVPFGTLSEERDGIAVVAAGNKILFAGGFTLSGGHSSRVDIYDQSTQTWSTAELSVPRALMASVAAGDRIFFAGGETGDGTWPVSTVDIYNVSNNTWSVTQLSTAGNSIVGATVGNKVLFAGGDGGFSGTGRESRVDIYNLLTNSWSTSLLSEVKRGFHAAVTINDRVYFAGGETWPSWPGGSWGAAQKIEIYDNATGTWSSSSLSQGKMGLTGTGIDGKIYWAGGQTGWAPSLTPTCTVEIFDVNTGAKSIQYMFSPADWSIPNGQNTVVKDNKIIFYRPYFPDNNKFDIYDIINNRWSLGTLLQPIPEGASIISVNNSIYVVGGYVNGILSKSIWRLQF